MASQLKPEIALGFKSPQAMTLGDLMGTATKAMEFTKLQELYPEIIGKAKAESQSAQMGLAQKQLGEITSNMTALINNPLVIKAEADPNSINSQELLDYVTKHGMNQARLAGVPENRATELLAPYIKIATENPGQLRQFAKERLLAGLDSSARTTQLGGPSSIGVSTIPPNQPAFRPRGVTAADMTAPIQVPSVAPGTAVQTPEMVEQPILGSEPGVPRAPAFAQAPAQSPAMQNGPGYSLRYEPPRPGIPRPTLPSEATDLAAGQKYRTDLLAGQQTVPKAIRNVDAVLSGIKELELDRRFTTGPLAKREQYIREFFGDERFKQLSKDIANVELAVLQASGGSMTTDAGKSLVAKANGDETYPPSVLLSVANRLAGDLTRLDMEAQAAQKSSEQFGDSNLPGFRQAWADNADQKIFEAIFINKNERDPKRRQELLDKILPKNREELAEFLEKYENIQKLTKTGRLR